MGPGQDVVSLVEQAHALELTSLSEDVSVLEPGSHHSEHVAVATISIFGAVRNQSSGLTVPADSGQDAAVAATQCLTPETVVPLMRGLFAC